ncbi:MAG TPA: hypothetical protein VLE19_13740 [Pyrinomonadaceae bacterium]|nr:hypothetical protein [Pyrinomonadaceae bacterium]
MGALTPVLNLTAISPRVTDMAPTEDGMHLLAQKQTPRSALAVRNNNLKTGPLAIFLVKYPPDAQRLS